MMDYEYDLSLSTNKEDKKLVKNWGKFNKEYAEKVLMMYLERCKLRHSFAFCQFRKLLPDAKLSDLREIFDDRKDYIIKLLSYIKILRKEVKKGGKIPMQRTLIQEYENEMKDFVRPSFADRFKAGILKLADKYTKIVTNDDNANFDAILNVAMKMEMDLKNKLDSLEEAHMINPLDPKVSLKEAIMQIRILDFYT